MYNVYTRGKISEVKSGVQWYFSNPFSLYVDVVCYVFLCRDAITLNCYDMKYR